MEEKEISNADIAWLRMWLTIASMCGKYFPILAFMSETQTDFRRQDL